MGPPSPTPSGRWTSCTTRPSTPTSPSTTTPSATRSSLPCRHGNLTWDNGFTLALSGNLTHALAPGILTGDVTLGANIGLIPGQQGLKLIGTGDISVWGMSYAGAALLMDLGDPVNPTLDFAFETPQAGNPLSFLMPAQAQLEASLDTSGMLAGFGLGVGTFVDRLTTGTLEVGQEFFDASLDALAADLERAPRSTAGPARPRRRPQRRRVGRRRRARSSTASASCDGVKGWIEAGPGSLPVGSHSARPSAAQMFMQELLHYAEGVLASDGSFDLADVFTKADYMAFAQLLGSGNEAVAALLGVLRDAVRPSRRRLHVAVRPLVPPARRPAADHPGDPVRRASARGRAHHRQGRSRASASTRASATSGCSSATGSSPSSAEPSAG